METENVSKLLPNNLKGYITELRELIFAGAKLVWDKIGVILRNQNGNTNSQWEIRLEWRIKKLQQQAKVQSKKKRSRLCLDE